MAGSDGASAKPPLHQNNGGRKKHERRRAGSVIVSDFIAPWSRVERFPQDDCCGHNKTLSKSELLDFHE